MRGWADGAVLFAWCGGSPLHAAALVRRAGLPRGRFARRGASASAGPAAGRRAGGGWQRSDTQAGGSAGGGLLSAFVQSV